MSFSITGYVAIGYLGRYADHEGNELEEVDEKQGERGEEQAADGNAKTSTPAKRESLTEVIDGSEFRLEEGGNYFDGHEYHRGLWLAIGQHGGEVRFSLHVSRSGNDFQREVETEGCYLIKDALGWEFVDPDPDADPIDD